MNGLVLVTGAGNPVAQAVVRRLRQEGLTVLLSGAEAEGADLVAPDVQGAVKAARERGRVELIVHAERCVLPEDANPEEVEDLYRIHAMAASWAAHYAFPEGGCLVHMCETPFPAVQAYGATKAAEDMLSALSAQAAHVRAFALVLGHAKPEQVADVVTECWRGARKPGAIRVLSPLLARTLGLEPVHSVDA